MIVHSMRALALFGVLAFVAACGQGNSAQAVSEKDVEKIVAEYVANNGDKLMESIQNFQLQERMNAAKDILREYSPVRGAADAPITIVEFSEFECPFCRRVQPTLTELMRRYDGKIKMMFKHNPLIQIHPNAMGASMASMAAHKQGKFWEFNAALFDQQEFSGERLWRETAEKLELDMDKFEKDRTSEDIKKQIEQDMADAQSVGGGGTPFFLINGYPLSGAQPVENFVQVIEDQLKRAPAEK